MKSLFFFICMLVQMTFLYSQSKMELFDRNNKVIELCGLGQYTFSRMTIPENIPSVNSCLPEENFSGAVSWIKFPIDQPGYLEFILTPKFWNHDLDFELYNVRLDEDIVPGTLVRCNANGANLGEGVASNEICLGTTGMKTEEALIFQYAGCTGVVSNYVVPAYTKKGEIYYLKIINQSGKDGFTLELGGTTSIVKDQEIDFEYSFVKSKSQFEFQPLLSARGADLNWNFGLGAKVVREETDGKVMVKYEVDGPKTVRLTQDLEGCFKQVEKTLEVKNSEIQLEVKKEFAVFPNPVSAILNVSFEIAHHGNVSLRLHSVNGSVLYYSDAEYSRGAHKVTIDCASLLSGTYILEVQSSTQRQFQKIIKVGSTK